MVGGFDASFFYSMEEQTWRGVFTQPVGLLRICRNCRSFIHEQRSDVMRVPCRELGGTELWLRSSLSPSLSWSFISLLTEYERGSGFQLRMRSLGYERCTTRKLQRNPMGWRSVLRLTKLGRPPIYQGSPAPSCSCLQEVEHDRFHH